MANLGYGLRPRTKTGAKQHTLVFDTGTEGATFLRNCRNMAIDLGEVEEIAVTHGQWDHMGALTAAKMEAQGARVVNDGQARALLDGHFHYSGEIPRVSAFEKGREDHFCRKDNSEERRPHPFLMDERALIVNVRDLGLVVFSACSPAGIVNVCTEAKHLFPDIPIHAVMGDRHLDGVMERLIPQTVEALGPFDIGCFITGRCTGWRALHPLAYAYAIGSASRPSARLTRSTPPCHSRRVRPGRRRSSRQSRPGKPIVPSHRLFAAADIDP